MANALTSLTLYDYSDKELLAIVADVAEKDGWATTKAVAKQLGIGGDRPHNSVGIRLAWMRRYGVVEMHDTRKSTWRVSAIGDVFLNGQLTSSAQNALEKMEPGQLFMVTRFLADQYIVSAEPVGHMLRREWRHGTGLR